MDVLDPVTGDPVPPTVVVAFDPSPRRFSVDNDRCSVSNRRCRAGVCVRTEKKG